MTNSVKIAITFDAEFDAFDSSIATINSSNLNGINHGYPVAKKILEKL